MDRYVVAKWVGRLLLSNIPFVAFYGYYLSFRMLCTDVLISLLLSSSSMIFVIVMLVTTELDCTVKG